MCNFPVDFNLHSVYVSEKNRLKQLREIISLYFEKGKEDTNPYYIHVYLCVFYIQLEKSLDQLCEYQHRKGMSLQCQLTSYDDPCLEEDVSKSEKVQEILTDFRVKRIHYPYYFSWTTNQCTTAVMMRRHCWK